MAVSGSSALVWLVLAQVAPAEVKSPDATSVPSEVKASFLKLLDRPRVPLDVKTARPRPTARAGLVNERLSFASEKKADGTIERVPVLVVRPGVERQGRRPAVIVLHGTGGSKDGMRSLARRPGQARHHRRGDRRPLPRRPLRRGQGVGRLQRGDHPRLAGQDGRAAGAPVLLRHLLGPLAHARLPRDARRRRPEADRHDRHQHGRHRDLARGGGRRPGRGRRARPSACRASAGAWRTTPWQGRANTIKAAHEAAAEGPGRVGASTPRSAASSGTRSSPASSTRIDCPSMIRLFAGRPLLILNGELDPNCPIGGAGSPSPRPSAPTRTPAPPTASRSSSPRASVTPSPPPSTRRRSTGSRNG